MEVSAGEYSVDEDDQLQPEDTLVDRGVADVLDEGYSPPERPYGRGSLARRRKAWSSCWPRKSRIRQCGCMTRSTRTSSDAPTKRSGKPSFRSKMRWDVRGQVDLSRRIRGLAKT